MPTTGFSLVVTATESGPRWFDSHCHLDLPAFDADRAEVLNKARQAGVDRLLIPAVAPARWASLLELCTAESGLLPALGLHPQFVAGHGEKDLLPLEPLLAAGRAVAVGECGLDRYHGDDQLDLQRRLFDVQISLASQYHLPLVIHARRAVQDCQLMLRAHTGVRGVFHSFSGSYQQASQLLDAGFLLGFGGPVTHDRATRLRDLVRRLPAHGLLLETDAPDQPDLGWRGRRNEPARLPAIGALIAELRGCDAAELACQSHANASELFRVRRSAPLANAPESARKPRDGSAQRPRTAADR